MSTRAREWFYSRLFSPPHYLLLSLQQCIHLPEAPHKGHLLPTLPLKEGGREGGRGGAVSFRCEGCAEVHVLLPFLLPSLHLPQPEVGPYPEDFVFVEGEVEEARA